MCILLWSYDGVVIGAIDGRMTYGTTFDDGTHICERFNSLYVQKKQNHGQNWTRGSYSAYDHFNTFRREQDLIYPTYPSLTAWSEACLREGLQEENTRYASWKRIIHQKSGRTLQNLRSQLNANTKMSCQSPRFVLGDQSLTVDGYAAAESTQHRKKRCVHDGRSSNDTGSYRVLQALGSDVIAHWLTPMDMYNVKCAFRNDWKWARVWRGCRVKSPGGFCQGSGLFGAWVRRAGHSRSVGYAQPHGRCVPLLDGYRV